MVRTSRFSLLLVFLVGLPLTAAAGTRSGTTVVHRAGVAGFQVPGRTFTEDELQPRAGLPMDRSFQKFGTGDISPARVPAAHVPRPATAAVMKAPPGVLGFDGLTVLEQGLASGFAVEPPDQALAVGQGFVLEGVNLAIRVYEAATGAPLTPAVDLNTFFGLSADDFTSDPKAYYDDQTQRWFVTILQIDPNFTAAHTMVAVSDTNDPAGSYTIYSVDATDAATPGCPCFGDQPLIGADANGFYINTNQFSLITGRFVGTEIFALDKAALVAGAPTVNEQDFLLTSSVFPVFYSLQPATVPPGGVFETAQGGTEYLMGSLDDFNTLTDQIVVMALTNTGSLSTTPDLTLHRVILPSQVYGPTPAAEQPLVPVAQYDPVLPLAALLRSLGFNAHEELVDTNDDRMAQVVFADGHLFGALGTVVQTANGPPHAGIAWFAVSPGFDGGGRLTAAMANQGYLAVNGQSLTYPSIGMNAAGQGIMAFTLVGPGFDPSAAYAPIDVNGTGAVHVLAPGVAPDDGFSGYEPWGFRVGRWGDYSAAVADETGAIWVATEYIPAKPRATFANWGTRISVITP
jgi:hypothetical protein